MKYFNKMNFQEAKKALNQAILLQRTGYNLYTEKEWNAISVEFKSKYKRELRTEKRKNKGDE